MLIYLDLCAIQRPLDDQSQLRVRLEAEAVDAVLGFCHSGVAALVSSDALTYEAGRNPDLTRLAHALTVLAEATVNQPTTPDVESRAAALVAAGFRPLDALHVASAEAVGADYFCTCDDRCLRRARTEALPPLRAMSPLELTTELNL